MNSDSYIEKQNISPDCVMSELNHVAHSDFSQHASDTAWDQTVIEDATLDDIDLEAIEYFKNEAISAKRLDESILELSAMEFLRKLELVNQSGQLTIAALLLFGKDIEKWNPTATFRIGRFHHLQDNPIHLDIISCPLIKMPNQVMRILRTNYLVRPIHYEGMQRIEPLEIPEDALRMMICNAILHKDHTDPSIQMRIWDDRIELTLLLHESLSRTPLLTHVFYLADFIDKQGNGFEIIHNAFVREHLLQPTYDQVEGGVMVTIPREKFVAINTGRHLEKLSANKLQRLVEGISDGLKEGLAEGFPDGLSAEMQHQLGLIIGTIHEHPGITISEIAQRTDLPKKTLEHYLSLLDEWKIVEFRGAPDTAGYYSLVIR